MAATRLEVRLSDQVNERIEALAAAEGMTKTDVFRRALALYLLAKERQKAGAQLQFAQGNNTETLVSI
jgi:predicted transcriptional regulator